MYGGMSSGGEWHAGHASTSQPQRQQPFRVRVAHWLDLYYHEFGVADSKAAFHKPDIAALRMPSALKDYVAQVDSILRLTAERLRQTQQYDNRVRFYKALRHLYLFITGDDFPSQIDPDGDWIMGYLQPTYPYNPRYR